MIDAYIYDKLTPEEHKSINVILPLLKHVTYLKSIERVPVQAYSEEQIKQCTSEQLQKFFDFFELPKFLRNIRGIVQILRFLDSLTPSRFRDVFTYSYSRTKGENGVTLYFSGKLLKPVQHLQTGYEYAVLSIFAELTILPQNSLEDIQDADDSDEQVTLYL